MIDLFFYGALFVLLFAACQMEISFHRALSKSSELENKVAQKLERDGLESLIKGGIDES